MRTCYVLQARRMPVCYHAAASQVKPVLFLNKVDRLILELRLPPEEAAARLSAIVSHANMVWSAFASEHFIRETDAVLAAEQQHAAAANTLADAGGEAAVSDAEFVARCSQAPPPPPLLLLLLAVPSLLSCAVCDAITAAAL
jgi:translation elongation factor EF-G